jgi:trigger factor
MQIVEKKTEGLSRVYGVHVAAADLAARLDARITEMQPQVQLKGFRKGKVPTSHIKKMFGGSIMRDVVQDTLQAGVNSVVERGRLATRPEITAAENIEAAMEGKADLSFDVSVELMPEFEPADVSGIEIERLVGAPTDTEIDEALASIAEGNKSYEAKSGKAPKAATGDQVVIDFVGKRDGVAFDGGSAQDAPLVLGSGMFIPGFEDQLVGVKAGDEKTITVTFPENYQAAQLAGKEATFDVVVKAVNAPAETKIDDEFARKLGLSDLATLKDAVRKQLQAQYDQLSRVKAKRALLDKLDAAHSFDLPARMVEAEFDGIWKAVEADRARGEVDPDDVGKSEDDLKAEYRKIAERRVRLGLVLAEIGTRAKVEVKDEEVARAVNAEAMRYPGQERQVVEYYQKTPNAVAALRAPIFEEKVVDLILTQVKTNERTVTRAELEAEDAAPGAAPAAEAKAKKPTKAKAAKAEAPAETEEAAPAKPRKAPARKKAADAE